MAFEEKSTPKGNVRVGPLPDDFLRFELSTQQRMAMADAQTAAMLQQQQQRHIQPVVPGAMMSANIAGKLSVTVSQAKLAKNYGLTKMDPYCRLRVGHAVFETPTASNGAKNPRWNKTIQSYLPSGVDSIYLEIFDEKTFQVDERVAWGHMKLPEVVFNGETHEDWYPLSGKQGEEKEGMINLLFSVTPIQMPLTMPQFIAQPQQQPIVMMPQAPQVPQAYYMPVAGGGSSMYAGQEVRQRPVTAGGANGSVQSYSDDDVNVIKEMFPTVEIPVIKSVLEANRGNKDASINALLAMGDD